MTSDSLGLLQITYTDPKPEQTDETEALYFTISITKQQVKCITETPTVFHPSETDTAFEELLNYLIQLEGYRPARATAVRLTFVTCPTAHESHESSCGHIAGI